jgi:hypothetical protein
MLLLRFIPTTLTMETTYFIVATTMVPGSKFKCAELLSFLPSSYAQCS